MWLLLFSGWFVVLVIGLVFIIGLIGLGWLV